MDYSILTGFSIRYLMTKKRSLNEILKGNDLNTIDGVLLVIVGKHPGLGQEKIGDITLFDGASIARSLKRLEKGELVERKVHPMNHRKKVVNLTSKGEKFLAQIEEADRKITDQLFEGFSLEEQKCLEDTLAQVYHNFDDLEIPK